MKTITLPYWGQIIGAVSKTGKDSRSLFITRQQQMSTSSLYILDNKGEQFSLSATILPCAMQAIVKINDGIIMMLGHDGHLYQTDWQAKKVQQVSTSSLLDLAPDLGSRYAFTMATLDNALVILYPNQLVIWPYSEVSASIKASTDIIIEPYPASASDTVNNSDMTGNRATALATSNDGKWLVIGDKLGLVSSYQWSGETTTSAALSFSSRHQSHQGAVSALLFEPIGQYFFSAGTDKNLYRTHVQGDLHPVDRAKNSQHSQKITALCVSDSRLFTAADDKVIKSWAFDKGAPSTCKEDLVKTRLLELSSYAEQPVLIAIGSDQSLRFIPIGSSQDSDSTTDNTHKLQDVACIIKDGYQRINDLLTDHSNNSDVAFKEGLALLQSQADDQNLEVVNQLLTAKSGAVTANQALQLVAWVAKTALDKSAKVLEQLLNSTISASVRLAAFQALADKATTAERPLQYLERALASKYEEVIAAALQGYVQVAINDADSQRRLLPILQEALSHKMLRIRKQALSSLETLLPSDSPKADLLALDCSYSDVIQAGLIRLYQRNMLGSLEVARQLMLLKSHHNPEVRQTAFYISVLAHPKLIKALKQVASQQGDTQLVRTLSDFDDFRLLRGTLLDNADSTTNNAPVNSDQIIDLSLSAQDFVSQTTTAPLTPATKRKAVISSEAALSDDALEPLLQSLANTYQDISFRAAYALACLQDERAFGTLIRLMHTDDGVIRAGVATALGNLNMPDGKAVLPALLDDKDAGVRLVAMKAFGKLADNALSWAAIGFASTQQDIHEQSLAIFLTQVLADGKAKPEVTSQTLSTSAEMTAVLLQALNNPFTSIRLEVVKVLLNRQLEPASQANIVSTIELLQQSLFEDVHQVAVEEWQRSLLNTKSNQDTNNQAVLALFFSDNFTAVRQQAFTIALKYVKRLNLTDIISSALNSPYIDIKQLALTTLQAKASVSQLKQLLPALVAMLADESLELRRQALNVALSLTDLQPISLALVEPAPTDTHDAVNNDKLISAALASPYPDIQLKVAQLLASHSATSTQSQNAESIDARAYDVFKRYLDIAIPTHDKNSDEYIHWHQHITQALSGLAQLANPAKYDAIDWYAKYLHHPDADFSHLAPKLMCIVSLGNATDLENDSNHIAQSQLSVAWQKDERAIISQSASLALAVWGDARGQHFLTQTKETSKSFNNLAKPLTPMHWLQARQGLGITHARQLRALFDTKSYAAAARMLLIFNDIQRSSSDTDVAKARPQQLIEALSFADNETAVLYANILARLPTQYLHHSLEDIWQYLSDYLSRKMGSLLSAHSSVIDSLTHNIKGSDKDTVRSLILQSVSPARLQQLALLTSNNNAQPLIRAQAISVICHLSELLAHDSYDNNDEVLAILQKWQRGLQALLATTKNHAENQQVSDQKIAVNVKAEAKNNIYPQYPYQNLAFGAWLGVIREGDNDYAKSHTTDQAIRGLRWLGMQPTQSNNANNHASSNANHHNWQNSVSLVLLPLLNHSDFNTRELVWDSLEQLKVPAEKLTDYALSTPYPDMIKRGLHLLLNAIADNDKHNSTTASIDHDGNKQLIALLKTNNQTLAEETYRLLKERLGLLPASLLALDSYCKALTYQVVREWQQVVITPVASSHTELARDELNKPSQSKLREDKLTFLRQASQHDEWRVRYQAFAQLLDYHEMLFLDTKMFDALFDFWRDSQSWSDEKQVFALIIDALHSYKRVTTTDNSLDNKSGKPKSALDNAAILIIESVYSKLLNLLDYPQRKMPELEIYQGIASLRDTTIVAELLQRLRRAFEQLPNNNKSARQQIFDALVTISGYDQPIEDYLDESEDKRWLQRQYPRHPQVLLSLFSTLMNYGDYEHAAQLLASLSWVKNDINSAINSSEISSAIDSALALAYEQLPAKHTLKLVQALAYRAERRDADTASLQKALSNKDADVQFLAAEGLAKCGQAQGLNTLMATVDYNPDGEWRRRSVLAIGELMGSRQHNDAKTTASNNAEIHTIYKAYDKLIKLAEDEEHYLQDVASEALGRLAQGDDFEYSSHIFELLKSRLLDPDVLAYNPAITHWLNGLRWLNTTASWEQIRRYIKQCLQNNVFFAPQTHAISLLPFNDSDANKLLLLHLLQQSDLNSYELTTAYAAAQKLWGSEPSQIYPYDWATIQNADEYFAGEIESLSLKRIVNHATIDELTTFITQHSEQLQTDIATALQNAVMKREDMSQSQLIHLVTSSNKRAQLIGLNYLAQYPVSYLDKAMFETLQQRFDVAKLDWQRLIDSSKRSPIIVSQEQWLASVAQTTSIIKYLLWLTCRYLIITKDKTNLKQVVENVTSYLSGTKHKTNVDPIIESIDWLNSLHQLPTVNASLPLATTVDIWWQQLLLALLARPVADDALLLNVLPTLSALSTAQPQPLSYANQTLLMSIITRLKQSEKSLEDISARPHTIYDNANVSINQQLLLWLKTKDAKALYHCAIEEDNDLSVRVQAIEALGQLHEPKIQEWLESLMSDASENSDDIQKLAYNVRRRWQRNVARAQKKRPLAFASMDLKNSVALVKTSQQGAGEDK